MNAQMIVESVESGRLVRAVECENDCGHIQQVPGDFFQPLDDDDFGVGIFVERRCDQMLSAKAWTELVGDDEAMCGALIDEPDGGFEADAELGAVVACAAIDLIVVIV